MEIQTATGLCLHCGAPTLEGTQRYCCSACEWLASDEAVRALAKKDVPDKWRPFNDIQIWRNYNQSKSSETLRFHLHIGGLQCSSCVHLLEKLPEYDPSIRQVRVRYGESDLFLETGLQGQPGRIAALIEDMGYDPHFLKEDHDAFLKQRDEDRALLRRIAVAGACSGNIMLFTIPIYAGLAGSWKDIFNVLSLLLFLPILFYSAIPFYRGAWASLRTLRLNVDLPLTVALVGGFVASTWNLLHGSDFLYYDSTAGFLFLILISRWFLRKSHRHWTQPDDRLPWTQDLYQVADETGNRHNKLFSNLKENDLLHLNQNDFVPGDGLLESAFGSFSTALQSGEPFPRTLQKGQKILGGFKVLSTPCLVRLTRAPQESEMAKVWKNAQTDALYKGRKLNLFDQAAQILLAVVLTTGLAVLFLAPWLGLSWNDGFQRALALWIVACPCALAFGGPLAYAMALRQAARLGILIKSADVFDRLTQIRHIAFDKTGTLTEGRLQLLSTQPRPLPPLWKSLILGLEQNSYHPIANALREAWGRESLTTRKLEQVHEVIGSKVFGIFEHQLYSVQASGKSTDKLVIEFRRDQSVLAELEFEDLPRPEARSMIQFLQKKFKLSLLSGDRQERADQMGRDLGLLPQQIRGDLSPADKAAIISAEEQTLMIGDGANDGPAFAKASVAIAMSGALEQSLQLADIYLTRPGLHPLKDLFQISEQVQKTLRRNLIFALSYNIIAGAFALAGFMNPLIAALLMPISSLLILASTWKGAQ